MICYQHIVEYKCFKYNIKDNVFSSIYTIKESGCQNEIVYLEIEYFPETNEVLSGCKGANLYNSFTVGKFSLNDNSFTTYDIDIPTIDGCPVENSPNFFHFIYTSSGYSIIKDMGTCIDGRVVSIGNTISSTKLQDYPTDEVGILVCEGYYSYDGKSCVNTIEEGYYCNDTQRKTLDKCHDDCISCYNGPNNESTNCKKCKGSKIVDYGNCVTSCNNDKTYNYPIDTTNLFCECQKNEKCAICTPDSYSYDLCLTCNEEKGYYPKYSNETNSSLSGPYINCYKSLEGYYLDNNIFMPCYSKCKSCYGYGNSTFNNCSECKDEYMLLTDYEYPNLCKQKCDTNYYYINIHWENNIECVNSCPYNFPKLITKKNKCINECKNDNIYKYEYDNECYERCPSGTQLKAGEEYLCEVLNCPVYYDYNQTNCITEVPEGYYANSTNTIDKCHDNCKTCNEGPKTNNHSCISCKDDYYYDYGNCESECPNGFYTEGSINKCKCSTNITCEICTEESKEYNLCDSCNKDLGYYPLKDDINNINPFFNCYNNETKPQNYYLDNIAQLYKPCHMKCNECSEESANSQLCISCNVEQHYYPKSDDISAYINCYKTAPEKYYFNSSSNQFEPCPSKCKKCTQNSLIDQLCTSCNIEENFYPKSDDTNTFKNCYNDDTIPENYFFNNSNQQFEPCPTKCKNVTKKV